jgi:hypothetical protein
MTMPIIGTNVSKVYVALKKNVLLDGLNIGGFPIKTHWHLNMITNT